MVLKSSGACLGRKRAVANWQATFKNEFISEAYWLSPRDDRSIDRLKKKNREEITVNQNAFFTLFTIINVRHFFFYLLWIIKGERLIVVIHCPLLTNRVFGHSTFRKARANFYFYLSFTQVDGKPPADFSKHRFRSSTQMEISPLSPILCKTTNHTTPAIKIICCVSYVSI